MADKTQWESFKTEGNQVVAGVLAAMIDDCTIKVEHVATTNAPAKDEARVA